MHDWWGEACVPNVSRVARVNIPTIRGVWNRDIRAAIKRTIRRLLITCGETRMVKHGVRISSADDVRTIRENAGHRCQKCADQTRCTDGLCKICNSYPLNIRLVQINVENMHQLSFRYVSAVRITGQQSLAQGIDQRLKHLIKIPNMQFRPVKTNFCLTVTQPRE